MVTLHDGTQVDLFSLSPQELDDLHWREERLFAAEILRHPPGSDERKRVTQVGYDLVNGIVVAKRSGASETRRLGLRDRDVSLVRQVLGRAGSSVGLPRVFEVGFGFGELLIALSKDGHAVGGIEVAESCYQAAKEELAGEAGANLLVGSLVDLDLSGLRDSWDVVYWNDVFEHIPPDEIHDYLSKINGLLKVGGILVTITPNWHVRPTDVTRLYRPPRSEAEGFHLKEYKLREIRDLLKSTGFTEFEMPLAVLPRRAILRGKGAMRAKLALEPMLELLPIRLARVVAGGLGYHCSIATKDVGNTVC